MFPRPGSSQDVKGTRLFSCFEEIIASPKIMMLELLLRDRQQFHCEFALGVLLGNVKKLNNYISFQEGSERNNFQSS